MKKQTFLILFSTTLLLLAAFALFESAAAQANFNAYLGASIDDSQIDGNIGTEWDDAGHVGGVAINPTGTANVWTKNDGTYLYIAFQFNADSNNPWVGIQFGGNGSMEAKTDAALFGNDNYDVDKYVDCFMSPGGGAKADIALNVNGEQNGVGALNVTSSNLVTVELKKPLNSNDTAGYDIRWAVNETQQLTIIWDSDRRGSSGGATNHYGNNPVIDTAMVRTILINSNSIAQAGNPILTNIDTTTLVIIIITFVAVVIVIIVGVIWVRKRGTKKNP